RRARGRRAARRVARVRLGHRASNGRGSLGWARMAEEKLRLGGMALPNGVLVHGPTAWACAVRTPSGELKVAADRKRLQAAKVEQPLLRGPARLVEAIALLPRIRRRLPEARLPFERPGVLAAMLASAAVVRVVR